MAHTAGFKSLRRNLLVTSLVLFSFTSLSQTALAQIEPPTLRQGFVSLQNLDPAKKTVCAITLNSENEILEFQKQLPTKDFQFVELVDDQEKWLTRACQAKVKCDILVVSGHFGGSFFGDKGSLELSELETNTCGQGCSGIFHDPKEVFLFGCNTLAGKTRDHRSPEQYRQVLINDGFNRAQADQIVALRYSPMGQTFNDRMARVFAGVPRIYGFTSVGPSGNTVEPLLKDYFKRTGDYGKYMTESFVTETAVEKQQAKNKTFFRSLKQTAVAQVAGAARDQHNLVPMCFIRDKSIGETPKIKWIHEVLTNPKTRLLHLTEILHYLNTPRSGSARALETKLFGDLINDQSLRNDMRNLILTGLKDYPLLRFDALKIGSYFGWFNLREVVEIQREFVLKHLNKDMGREDVDLLCSVPAVGPYVTVDMIQGVTPRDASVFAALACLKPTDVRIHELVYEKTLMHFQSLNRLDIGNPLLDAMLSMPIRDLGLATRMLNMLVDQRDEFARSTLRDALGNIPLRDEKFQLLVFEKMIQSRDDKLRMHLANIISKWKPESEELQRRVVEQLALVKDDDRTKVLVQILGATSPTDPKLHQLLFEKAKQHSLPFTQQAAMYALGQSHKVSLDILKKLIPMAYPIPGGGMSLDHAALMAILNQVPRDKDLLLDLVYLYRAQKGLGNNKNLILAIFETSGTRDVEVQNQILNLARGEQDEDMRKMVMTSLKRLGPEDPQILEVLSREETFE